MYFYKHVDRADVNEYSAKEYPEDLGLGWYIGDFFDSVGSDETDETGAEDVTDTETESKVE